MEPLDPVRDLHPPRLPEAFAGLGWPEIATAFGLGILAALLLFEIARPWLKLRRRARLEDRLAALRDAPAETRILGLMEIARSLDRTPPEDLRAALYAPAGASERAALADRLEAALRALRKKAPP
ncbi:hypothetical protein [Neomegalonema sp.]|uniref:hypothetical protein n=1 Tax=Neomegalonema sp. TaxID=2039713 RepID=UPI00262639FB|nr:hypothetical protein [Neomegalonema sp.]MDD2867312.1 hypothetical protein [Neomegalonema sp.]